MQGTTLLREVAIVSKRQGHSGMELQLPTGGRHLGRFLDAPGQAALGKFS